MRTNFAQLHSHPTEMGKKAEIIKRHPEDFVCVKEGKKEMKTEKLEYFI